MHSSPLRFTLASRSGRRFRTVARPLAALALAMAVLVPFGSSASAAAPGEWIHVGTTSSGAAALNGTVSAFAHAPSVLLVGGSFTNAGGRAKADYIASWNGFGWSPVGPTLNGAVRAIAYHKGKIYAGGVFQNAGGHSRADFLAVWDGASWEPFCDSTGPAFTAEVDALEIIGSTLFVGGSFQNGANIPSADGLLACDLTTGASSSPFEAPGDGTGTIYALTTDDDGALYAGGTFLNLASNTDADFVAVMAPGGGWSALGTSPLTGFVRSLASDGTDVFIGTDATDVAGIPQADHVVRWNGTAFGALGENTAGDNGWFPTTSFIYGMTTVRSGVVVTGSFQNANGDPLADNVAYFNGDEWDHVGSNGGGDGPWIGDGLAVATFNFRLYAGGGFTSAGGDTLARGIASDETIRPDARIGTSSAAGPWVGNNVYSATAAGETKTVSADRGDTVTFFLNFQNDGMRRGDFGIHGTDSDSGFTVKYFTQDIDFTQLVTGNGFFYLADPGGTMAFRMVVKVSQASADLGSFVVRLRDRDSGTVDAVRATVKAT
jgi:hypothetical protein